MYSKLQLKISAILFVFIAILSLSACNASRMYTEMKFSFDTNTPANSSDEKILYLNNDMDKLDLSAELKIDSGDAIIQVVNVASHEIVWSGSYQDNSNFIIELYNVKANSEYLLKIETIQSKKVSFIVTSDTKLVKDKEKPKKYINDSDTSESNIAEPIEMIIVVEPENININEIPEILTITIENISNAEWHGDYHCAIDFFNGDDWELVYAPVYIDLPFLIEANSTYTNYVPTDPDTINYTVGRYRVRFGVNIDGWGGWYGEFSIS